MKLEINYTKKMEKFTNMWRLNYILLNTQWVKEEIKREILKIHRDKWKCNIPKFMGCSKSSSKRDVCSNKSLSQETRKVSSE